MSWTDQFFEMLFPLDSAGLNMEGAYLLKYQNLPASIFKYRDVNENALKNLREDTIWLADPRTLNDPYECTNFIDFDLLTTNVLKSMPQQLRDRLPPNRATEIAEKVSESEDPQSTLFEQILINEEPEKAKKIKDALLDVTKIMFEEIASSSTDGFKDAFKLCSFSERVDSTLMWAHYANYHKGFCIEYDVKSVAPSDYVSRFLYPVKYSDTPFNATQNVLRVGHKNFNNLFLNRAGLIKSLDWAYEREWRLMFSNGVVKTAQPYKMPTPKAVYLGSHIGGDEQAKVIAVCASKGIPVMKMKHSRAAFSMQAISVEEADRKFFGKRS